MKAENFNGAARRANSPIDARLAAYLAAAGAVGSTCASEAGAVVVGNPAVQPFGVNEHVDIDFNKDGQIDFRIAHRQVELEGTPLNFLAVEKNDVATVEDPLAFDFFTTFPTNGTEPNNDAQYLAQDNGFGDLGAYPHALESGEPIGGASDGVWDFQLGDNFLDGGTYIRANRLIDQDMGQIDVSEERPVTLPEGTPGWVGLGGEVHYLGVRVDLNDAAHTGLNNADDQYWYGWIGVRIDNEADGTGAVVGYAYNSELGMPILAGDLGPMLPGDFNGDGKVDAADYTVWRDGLGTDFEPDDYNLWKDNFANPGSAGTASTAAAGFDTAATAVPEPSSLMMALCGGAVLLVFAVRRWFGSSRSH